jgi:hypothetical protein
MIDGLLLFFLVVLSNLSWFGIWVFVGFEKKIMCVGKNGYFS